MLMGHTIRTHLDQIKPDVAARVQSAQDAQKRNHDKNAKTLRSFAEGDAVFIRNFGDGEKWLPGTVEFCQGPVTYKVKLQDGKIVCCHITQIRKHLVEIQETQSSAADLDLPQLPNTPNPETTSEPEQPSLQAPPLRRSTRIRKPPSRYGEQISFS